MSYKRDATLLMEPEAKPQKLDTEDESSQYDSCHGDESVRTEYCHLKDTTFFCGLEREIWKALDEVEAEIETGLHSNFEKRV